MVKVDVATAVERDKDDGVDVVEDELDTRLEVVDVVLTEVVEEAGVVVFVLVVAGADDVVDTAVVERVVVELVVEEALLVLEVELDDPGALPTTDPTHAFQFEMPFWQVVEMDWPVCCKMVVDPREILIDTAPVRPLKGTLP